MNETKNRNGETKMTTVQTYTEGVDFENAIKFCNNKIYKDIKEKNYKEILYKVRDLADGSQSSLYF